MKIRVRRGRNFDEFFDLGNYEIILSLLSMEPTAGAQRVIRRGMVIRKSSKFERRK